MRDAAKHTAKAGVPSEEFIEKDLPHLPQWSPLFLGCPFLRDQRESNKERLAIIFQSPWQQVLGLPCKSGHPGRRIQGM